MTKISHINLFGGIVRPYRAALTWFCTVSRDVGSNVHKKTKSRYQLAQDKLA